MFRIGEFSKMAKTTVKTLRFYDRSGLLKPEETDQFTGYRLYTTDQLVRLHRIQALRQLGLSIGEIGAVLSGQDFRSILENRRAELLCELSEVSGKLSRLEFILREEKVFMSYAATIKELPECIVYSKKMTIPNYDAYFQLIPAIGEKVAEKYPDLKCTVPGYCFVVYLDGEYRDKDINVEFCEAVDKMKPDFDGIVFKKIEPVTAVSVMHRGPYSSLSQAYAYAFRWIEENGCAAAGPPRENYIDGIWNKEKEEDWLTEVQVPIERKA
ncbi:MAG: MerR family transcriptional regulator [Oscillospiraceae bacterium]|jgi:DNA-binding transcriptional MerR regulator